jgi:TolB-like protein
MESGGRFEIVEPLGAGALGRLYRARDARLGRGVALRIVDPAIADDLAARNALLADARRAAALVHPHAASLLDIVVVRHAHEVLCLVHELADGPPLSTLLAEGPIETRTALELAAQIAEALAAGTAVGIVHGALDPASVFVGPGREAKVVDFGLSRWTAAGRARAEAGRAVEASGHSVIRDRPSVLYYVSPEQLLGAVAKGGADVFALGAILYEMLTGRPAFSGESESALVLQILRAHPVPPSRLNPSLPAAVDAIVLRALAKSLDKRYPSAGAFAADLRQLLAAGVDVEPVERVEPAAAPADAAVAPAEKAVAPAVAEPARAYEPPPRPELEAAPQPELEPELEPAREAEPEAFLPPPSLFQPEPAVEVVPERQAARVSLFELRPSAGSFARADEPAGSVLFAREPVGSEAGDAAAASTAQGSPARGRHEHEQGERPGVRPAVWGMMAAAAVIVLLAGVAWFGRNALDLPWQDRVTAAARPNVLVAAFVVTGEHPPAYFGPGFAEDLAARLSEIPGATVVGRTAIREAAYMSDWQARARRMGATYVVRGTIKPGPYALHADAELLDAATGATIWSQHFTREPRQVAALQAEIAGQLAQRLRLVTPTSNRWARASVRKSDPAAYDLYLQAREAADRRDRARAIGLYDQAIQRDPGLVEARAALSQAIYLEEYYAGATRETSSSGRALREAEAALAVDAELPAAHLAAALAAPTITMAASSLSRALSYDGSNGETWHHAGDLVNELDPPKSIPFYRRSLALEPSIDANWRDLASAYATAGSPDGARDAIARGEAARPDRPWWKQMRARLDIEQGRYDTAIQALAADPSVESTPIVWLMGRVVPLAMAGRMPDARREAARLVERYPAFCEGSAVLSAVELDGGAAEQGRQRAETILAAAERPGAEPGAIVCAALAAAGTGDPAQAASWMSRLAGDERALRLWTRQAIFGVALSFRSRWYPWTKVTASQPMQVAASQLEASLQRIRDEVERRLPAPPGSTLPGSEAGSGPGSEH